MRIYSGYACIRRYIYIRIRIESHPARQKNARSCSISLSFSEGTRLRGVPKKNAFARSCERNFEVGRIAVSVPSKVHLFFMFIAFEGLFTASR